jgi:tetratricopeptide (TPR) repeat protein
MNKRNAILLAITAAALNAAPAADPDDLLRRATSAYDRGDFAAALDLCTRAEERSHDPGLVAYDKAAALYRLGHYRDAELHFRRCLDDAAGARRAGACYNLGNCLVQLAQGRDTKALTEAVRWYEQCLQRPDVDADLRASAEYNLEVAKLFLIEAQKKKEGRDSDAGENGNDPGAMKPGPTQPGADDLNTKPQPGTMGSDEQPGQQPLPTDQPPPPGVGNLPPIPDRDETVALSPEDALRYLQQAADRIQQERRAHERQTIKGPARGVKDW